MSSPPGRVLVVGDVMTDIVALPEGPPRRGTDRRATIRARPGGAAANQAAWLALFGVPVTLCARVGAADHHRLVAEFAAIGVVARLGADPERPTGTLIALVDPDGERSFLTDRGANLGLGRQELRPDLLDGVGLVLVSGYAFFVEQTRAAATALMDSTRAAGIAVAVDAASLGFLLDAGPGRFLEWTEGADLLFANVEEAAALAGTAEPTEQVIRLGHHYLRVVVKRGAEGALLGDRTGVRLRLPAPRVAVRDSTGAGDAFAAGFIAAERQGLGEAEALARAIAAGAEAVTRLGGRPPT